MTPLNFVICSSCSLSQAAPKQSDGRCLRCQNPIPVTPSSTETIQVSEGGDIAKEGKTALLIALQFSGLPDALRGAVLLSSLVIPTTVIPMLFWVLGKTTVTTTLFGAVGVFFIAMLWLNTLRVLLSKRALNVVLKRIQKGTVVGGLNSRCPGCNQETAAPSVDASFDCPTCGTSLLSSDGVIVSRVERDKNRVAAWTLRAKALVDADRLEQAPRINRQRQISKTFVAFNTILPIAALLWLFFGQPLH